MKKLFWLLFLVAGVARAEVEAVPASCGLPDSWSFQEILVSVVEPTRGVPVYSNGEPQVIMHQCFSTRERCERARNGLLAYGFTIIIGSGAAAQAHVGRSTSECVQR